MIEAHVSSPIPRQQVLILRDGSFALRRTEQSVQDLLTGIDCAYVAGAADLPAGDFELEQLKLAGVVEAYDAVSVWLCPHLEGQSAGLTSRFQSACSAAVEEAVVRLINVESLIASQADVSASHGKVAVIACKGDAERRAVMGVLNSLEMAVTSVSTAQETLNLLEDEPVDLLVMDVRLEDMHGWAMIGRLRELSNAASTRVIVLADGEVDEQVFALTVAKVDAYLANPLSLPLLRQTVWQLLSGNNAAQPAST